MKEIPLKVVQSIKLDALKAFSVFCREQSIDFFAAYGTLLGAVREKGYIPWDDDVDLFMLRDDFNKLLCFPSNVLGGNYYLQTYKTDSYFYLPIARICINGTYRCEPGLEKGKFNKGTIIDIFPLDTVPDNTGIIRKYARKCLFYISMMRYKSLSGHNKGLIFNIKKILLSCISFRVIQKASIKNAEKYRNVNSSLLFSSICAYGLEKSVFKKEWFSKKIYMDFENFDIPIPVGYDNILKILYGDYMVRPKENERKIDVPSYYL